MSCYVRELIVHELTVRELACLRNGIPQFWFVRELTSITSVSAPIRFEGVYTLAASFAMATDIRSASCTSLITLAESCPDL
jgi:hypothetical protein